MRLTTQLQELPPVAWFAIKAAGLLVAWQLIELWPGTKDYIHEPLADLVQYQGAVLLGWIGYETTLIPNGILVDGHPSIFVGAACNGLTTLLLFAGFVALTPGTAFQKGIYIVFGLIVLHLANVVRVAALAHGYVYHEVTFDFNHKYLYSTIIYGIVIALWMLWLKNKQVAKAA